MMSKLTRNPEIQNQHLLNLQEIHAKELQMLIKMKEIFEQNHLRYYLAGGTLLGAVRHKGFIPWDDDIDLLMPRPDYNRLQEIMANQPLMPEYAFHSSDLHNLNDPMSKLFDLSTTVDKKYIDDKYDRYLWIDIFPMDGAPENDEELALVYKKVLRARKRLRFVKAKTGAGKSKLKILIKPILKPFALLLFGKQRTVNYIERIAKKYKFDESQYVAGIVFGYGPEERMNRQEYIAGVSVDFEGVQVMAPGCYDHYLTNLYGDYHKLPPEDKRQVHFMKIYG